jgi:SAM-dependent methyltransferase
VSAPSILSEGLRVTVVDDTHRSLPLPPLEMRKLVGPTEDAAFDNPSGELVFPYLDATLYDAVFDFGCGCGRVARQLIQQRVRPKRYVGVDLHRGMIQWCRENLGPAAPRFEFHHHDVYNYWFNPDRSRPNFLPFPVDDHAFTLVNAFSVFTHLTQNQAAHYLDEVSRILADRGVFHSTWFLFDKRDFPMLHTDHNALYVSELDPSAAVLFDGEWVRVRAREAGLVIYSAVPPEIRGYQWILLMAHESAGLTEVSLPPDSAPRGDVSLPDMPADPSLIGLRED